MSLQLRDVVLVALVAQTTSVILLMRFTQTHQTDATLSYRPTVAVLMAEALKLPFCLVAVAWHCGSSRALAVLRAEVLSRTTLACAVPALAYTAQNNLLFVALANLEAPVYQVAYQAKTIFTAVFSVTLLRRPLKPSQWIAICLLTLGAILVSDLRGGGRRRARAGDAPMLGLASVLTAALLSGASGVYFEKMLKQETASAAPPAAGLFVRNVQLGLFALPLAYAGVLSQDAAFVSEHGLLQGFTGLVWAVVVLNGLGGILVAAVMKYADTIVKCFAAAIAILTGTILSVPLFGFRVRLNFVAGCACTCVASVLYARAPDLSRSPASRDADEVAQERETLSPGRPNKPTV